MTSVCLSNILGREWGMMPFLMPARLEEYLCLEKDIPGIPHGKCTLRTGMFKVLLNYEHAAFNQFVVICYLDMHSIAGFGVGKYKN